MRSRVSAQNVDAGRRQSLAPCAKADVFSVVDNLLLLFHQNAGFAVLHILYGHLLCPNDRERCLFRL